MLLLTAGFALAGLLLIDPPTGIAIVWNILIPAAPALVTVAPGLWRNICPMSTFSLLPLQLGLSLRRKMPQWLAAGLVLISVIALYAIVPLRHVLLDVDGPGDLRHARCRCRPRLWARRAVRGPQQLVHHALPNSSCGEALRHRTLPLAQERALRSLRSVHRAVPNSTLSMTPAVTAPNRLQRLLGNFLIGSFWGFVFGWYQVPDYGGHVGTAEIL